MNFCDECQTMIFKLQEDTCRVCNSKIQTNTEPIYYEKIYNNNETINNTEKLDEYKGTKIQYNCDQCSSKYMYYKAVQLRGADEGQTIFYECDCGYKKKDNS